MLSEALMEDKPSEYQSLEDILKTYTDNFTKEGSYPLKCKADNENAYNILIRHYNRVDNHHIDIDRQYDDGTVDYTIYFSEPKNQEEDDDLNESIITEANTQAWLLRVDGTTIPQVVHTKLRSSSIDDVLEDEEIQKEIKKYYELTDREESKNLIQRLFNHIDNSSDDFDTMQYLYNLIYDNFNAEFCKVRVGGMYGYEGESEIYFRIASKNVNWYNAISKFMILHKGIADYITVMSDVEITHKDTPKKLNGKDIKHMPVEEFIMAKGNPIVESKKIGDFEFNLLNNNSIVESYGPSNYIGHISNRYDNMKDLTESYNLNDIVSFNEGMQDISGDFKVVWTDGKREVHKKNPKKLSKGQMIAEDINEALEKATPYMLRSDGELFTCGKYHPYISEIYSNVYEDLESLVQERLYELNWFYDHLLSNSAKDSLRILYASALELGIAYDDDYTKNNLGINEENIYFADEDELIKLMDLLNRECNQEFCKVRTSDLKYGGDSNEIYFRIGSTGFNWFNLIFNVCMKNKNYISAITISNDKTARDFTSGNIYKVNGKEINHMPIEDFLTLKGSPIIESIDYKNNTLNNAYKSLTEGKLLSDALGLNPRHTLKVYKILDENRKFNFDIEEEAEEEKRKKAYKLNVMPDKNPANIPASMNGNFTTGSLGGGGFGESLSEAAEKHDRLNPDLWEDGELRQDVKLKLFEIARKFKESLAKSNIDLDITDIVIVGSNASYNYSAESDIDLHIVADMSEYEDHEDLVNKLYQAYKSLFNNKYDPSIRGHEVEVYVEADDLKVHSNGIYSLYDGWIKVPHVENIPDFDMNEIDSGVQIFVDRMNSCYTLEDVDELIDDLYLFRQQSILDGGEYDVGNIIFKQFRDKGYLKELKDKKVELENDAMSLQ